MGFISLSVCTCIGRKGAGCFPNFHASNLAVQSKTGLCGLGAGPARGA